MDWSPRYNKTLGALTKDAVEIVKTSREGVQSQVLGRSHIWEDASSKILAWGQ